MNNDSKAIEDLEDEISRLEKTNAKERLLRLNDKKYVSHKLKSESNTVKMEKEAPIPFKSHSVDSMRGQIETMSLLTGIVVSSFERTSLDDGISQFCIQGLNLNIPFVLYFKTRESDKQTISLRLNSRIQCLKTEIQALNRAAEHELCISKCMREFSLLAEVAHLRHKTFQELQYKYPQHVSVYDAKTIVLRNESVEFRIKWVVKFQAFRNAKVQFELIPHGDKTFRACDSNNLLKDSPRMFKQLLQVAEPQEAMEMLIQLLDAA